MNLTLEIPDEAALRFRKQAEARGLTVDRWLLELAEKNAPAAAPPERSFAEACASIRGLADDLEVIRDRSPGRDVFL
jgi:hypothetical protein